MDKPRRLLRFMLLATLILTRESNGQLMSKEHRTKEAAEKKNNLWCYRCDTIEDPDVCINLTGNHTSLIHKCRDDKRICMVKRFSYTTSTENMTSIPKMWGIERNCTNKCEPGCIVIGERTKLYSCTTCCEKSLCNSGNGTASDLVAKELEFFFAISLQLLLAYALKPSS